LIIVRKLFLPSFLLRNRSQTSFSIYGKAL
jgi:hypothetical protein